MEEKNKKMGRPRIPKEKARTKMFHIRLSPIELEAIEEKARLEGLSPSDWSRNLLINSSK